VLRLRRALRRARDRVGRAGERPRSRSSLTARVGVASRRQHPARVGNERRRDDAPGCAPSRQRLLTGFRTRDSAQKPTALNKSYNHQVCRREARKADGHHCRERPGEWSLETSTRRRCGREVTSRWGSAISLVGRSERSSNGCGQWTRPVDTNGSAARLSASYGVRRTSTRRTAEHASVCASRRLTLIRDASSNNFLHPPLFSCIGHRREPPRPQDVAEERYMAATSSVGRDVEMEAIIEVLRNASSQARWSRRTRYSGGGGAPELADRRFEESRPGSASHARTLKKSSASRHRVPKRWAVRRRPAVGSGYAIDGIVQMTLTRHLRVPRDARPFRAVLASRIQRDVAVVGGGRVQTSRVCKHPGIERVTSSASTRRSLKGAAQALDSRAEPGRPRASRVRRSARSESIAERAASSMSSWSTHDRSAGRASSRKSSTPVRAVIARRRRLSPRPKPIHSHHEGRAQTLTDAIESVRVSGVVGSNRPRTRVLRLVVLHRVEALGPRVSSGDDRKWRRASKTSTRTSGLHPRAGAHRLLGRLTNGSRDAAAVRPRESTRGVTEVELVWRHGNGRPPGARRAVRVIAPLNVSGAAKSLPG